MRAGIGDGIRIICQTFDLPDNVIAFQLVNAKGDLITHVLLHAFLTIPVVLRLGRLGHNIGAYLFGSGIVIVLIPIHPNVHIVAAGGGGNSFAAVGTVQQGHLRRVGIVVICAGVFHLVRCSIVGKVRSFGLVGERFLTQLNRTGLVLFAFLCNDGSLIAAIRIGFLVGKDLTLIYTGNALKLSRELTNALCRRADQRVGTVLVLDVGTVLVLGPVKVFCFKALKGQLFSYGVAIRQRVIAAIVVSATLHHKPDVVGTYLGGHRFRSSRKVICSAVLKGSLRSRIAEILRAGIDCRTGVEVKAEVRTCRLVRPCSLIDLKFTALVQRARFGTDVHLIVAVHIRMREVIELLVVVGAHKNNARLAHAILFAGNARNERAPVDVKVLLSQGREGQLFTVRDSIGAHFVLGAIVVVATIIHHDVNSVSACLGGLRHRNGRAILRDILDRIQRFIVKIHLAGIFCSLGLGVIRKVGALRLIFAYHLADIQRAFCVLVARLRYDALLVEAVHVRSRRVGCKHRVVVGAHIDEAQFAHAILAAGDGLMFDRPGNGKVALAQRREGQLSGGGHVHHNRLAVILGGQGQGLAVRGKLCAVVSADILAVDIRDLCAEGERHRSIADKVNRVCCYGIAVNGFHSAVHDHQLALLLTGGKVFAFNIATAYRIGNSSLAVITLQAAKDHGILDDRFLRGIVRQLDIVEHAAGDFAVLVQLDHSVECTAGDLAMSADDIPEGAACDGAVVIHVDILLEGAAFNGGILHINRAIRLNAGDGHICQRDLLGGNSHMIGVDGIRSKIHRVAVRGGDVERRALHTVLFRGGVLPAQTLIEVDRHALAGHRHTGHTGQVGQTLFGNAQGLEVAWIGGLIHKDLCAVIVAGNAQHLAVGRGVGVVAADRCLVDAPYIGVQGKFCAACAHQIDDIGGKRQSSAVHRSHTAVAHHQRAELLSCGQQLLEAVRQLAQNRIRNGVGVTAVGVEIAALDHRIGDRARAIAVQGIKGAAGDLDRTVFIDRIAARADIMEAAAADLTAGDTQSAVFAKHTAGNIGIGDLDIAVDGAIAQLTEIEVCTALIQDLHSAFPAAVVGVAVISPAVAHVNTAQLRVRVQTVHMGHVGQVGLTFTVKVQLCIAEHHRNQLNGCFFLRRDHAKAGGKRFSVRADADRGKCSAIVCEGVVLDACRQRHGTAAGRGCRPRIAAGVAFHCQFQIVPVTGIVILLDEIDIPGFLPAVQGAVFRQQQLVCLLLRISAQAGDIAEKAAPDIAAVLGQLIVGAAVNSAQVQLRIGVAAAQNVDAVHAVCIVGFYQECTGDSAVHQIHNGTADILDGHIAADRAVQNVLDISIAGTGDGQSGSFVKAPAGTGRCLGQTVRTDLDLDHLIFCFRVRTNILILVFRAVSDAVGLFRRGRKPCPCICKCGYREDGEHHTECQYHAHDAFFHDILSFVG